MNEEFSTEESAEHQRLRKLYRGLSEGDRFYIVERWDSEQELESPHQRLAHQRDAPRRSRRRRKWEILALILAASFFWWFTTIMDQNREGAYASFVLERLRERAKANEALDSAIVAAEREYQEWIEFLRGNREDDRN